MREKVMRLREACPDSIWRALPWLVLLCATLIAGRQLPKVDFNHMDFNLYYFGGQVERSGTYTDTAAVVHAASVTHGRVSNDGVYGSPSLVGLFFQPLSFLPLTTALTVWITATVALLAFAVRTAVNRRSWPAWLGLMLILACNFEAVQIGNFALTTTALLLLAYGGLCNNKPRLGGIALAFAIAFKLYPVFLLLPLLLKNDRRALKWTLAPLAILLAITPFTLGFHDTISAVRSTLDVASYVHPWIDNSGIPGTVVRAFHNQSLASWTGRVLMIATAVFVITQRRRSLSTLFALTLVTMTLSQNISWTMYYGTMFILLLDARNRSLHPAQWALLICGFYLATGPGLRPTYDLWGLPSGLPPTIGLLLLLAARVTYLKQDKKALVA